MQFVVLRTKNFQCWKFVCHNDESVERGDLGGRGWWKYRTVNFMHPHVLSHWAIVESWTKTIKSILFTSAPSSPTHHFRGEICVPCDVKCGWTRRKERKLNKAWDRKYFCDCDTQQQHALDRQSERDWEREICASRFPGTQRD